ncbi:MAG: O-antigen ligase family protein [Actinomycetospora chiangmaiensis]|nr:O-antigen ligase family protein [Actinomycetospora chiangmaiensis]
MSSTPSDRDTARRIASRTAAVPEPPACLDLSASRPARICALLAAVCFGAVLPCLMVASNRSAPATFGAGAALANLAVLLAGGAAALKQRYRAVATGPTALASWGVIALCVASFAWTLDPGYTRRGLSEGLPVLGFALASAAAWPLVARRRDLGWLAAGLVAATLLILLERLGGMPLHHLLRTQAGFQNLKRSAVPLVPLVWPAAAFALASRRVLLAAALFGAVVLGVVTAHAGAAFFGLAAGCVAWLAARLSPKLAAGATALLVLGLLATGPVAGTLGSWLVDEEARVVLREQDASERLVIWRAFEGRVHDRPILGHGFDTSYSVSKMPRPGGASPGPEEGSIRDIHPHNAPLQIWVELGLVGALATAIVAGFVLWRMARLPAQAAAPRFGLLLSVLGITLVGFGAWQSWWIASVAAALLWFDLVARDLGS